MSIEEREGTLDRVTEKGILLSGARLSYSKWFEGERPTEDLLGCKIRVVVDAGEKCTFLKKVIQVGDKAPGWKPPENPEKGSWGGGGRRLSPEELDLKHEEGKRIARCCAVERAIDMRERGITVHEIATEARLLEEYFRTGNLPPAASKPKQDLPATSAAVSTPSATPALSGSSALPESARLPASQAEAAPRPTKPKRLASQAVNALFNEALRGGVVGDWADFLALFEDVLKVKGKSPYQMDIPSFEKVESVVRTRLGRGSAA